MKISIILMFLLSNVCLADYMGDNSLLKGEGLYKVGSKVFFNVDGSGYTKDECDGVGTIYNYIVHSKTYAIRGVTCTDGNNEVWHVTEDEIFNVVKK